MGRFEKFIAFVLKEEGGYVDHPADRGGKTKYGITERTARAHGYRGDMRYLPLATAKQIYRDDYWDSRLEDSRIYEGLAHLIFDMNINHGARNSGRITQRGLVKLGYKLTVDGILGTQSYNVLKKCGYNGFKSVLAERRIYYQDIVKSDPSQKVFIKGWLSRCDWFETHYHSKARGVNWRTRLKASVQRCCCFSVQSGVDEFKETEDVVKELFVSLEALDKRCNDQQAYCERLEERLAKLECKLDAA